MNRFWVLLCLLLLAACDAAAEHPDARWVEAFPGVTFERPLLITHPPDGTDRLFVLEQDGRVVWLENRSDVGQEDVRVALDIRDRVRRRGGEEGLLGLAFHPDFTENRQVFLHYSASGPRRNVLSRWRMDEAGGAILPDTEEVLLEVEQPFGNHNGGMIAFGPDGYLYISLGDGGSGGDPHNNGQNLATLLGAILRIDVDRTEGETPYAIPADNPFVDTPGARPEIYAYGLRNVWRFSFDPETGRLWAGDVGQNAIEEIDLIVKGGNYGWNWMEGTLPYRDGVPEAVREELIPPVFEYSHNEGISITGGHVYRGEAIPALQGAYIYGDFGHWRSWALRLDGSGAAVSNEDLGRLPLPASFGTDRQGEIYAASYDQKLYKLVPRDGEAEPRP